MFCYQSDSNRPKSPTQFLDQMRDEAAEDLDQAPSPVYIRTPSPQQLYEPDCEATYEDQIDRYGWLAEVPGDPLNLK